jgi:probable F420-dependent oxidoreductase
MKVGVVFPQIEIGADAAAIRDYAQAVEGMGYTHILAYDHVLGADTRNRSDWRGAYTSKDMFHEVFVLFAHLAAITRTLEFVTGVLILPQRQTALVAKQAAEVDVLSGGRLRLGVGVGWNYVEYEALGQDFHTRGKCVEEQILVLRSLWTEPVVDFQGRYHRIAEAGINPLPVQRPIPVWIGGYIDKTLERAARMGDGWFPQAKPPDDTMRQNVEKLRNFAREAGRDPDSIGIEARVTLSAGGPDVWRQHFEGWRDLGATHISINTMGMGLASPQEHVDTLRRARSELGI